MAGGRAIVRRIDHMPFVVDDPGKTFSVLSEQLSLPTFARSSITVGNIDLFFFKLMGESPTPRKPIVGIAFEPESIDEAIAELDRRGIAHDYRVDDWESFKEIWCILLEFFGSRLVDYAFIAELQYPDRTTHADVREQRRSMLSASGGGVLAVESAAEVVVGAKSPDDAIARWQRLFDPVVQTAPGLWHLGDGPSLRIVEHERDSVVCLKIRTRSLDKAAAVLRSEGLLGACSPDEVALDPEAVSGIDLRLVP